MFLITFKPASENPERGWPLESLLRLVRQADAGEFPVENWRFKNRAKVKLDDRVFLLLQGKRGPAIIGHGRVAGKPINEDGTWMIPVIFERIVDPSKQVLATKSELKGLDTQIWNTQASGIKIPDEVATALEALVVGRSKTTGSDASEGNPDWTRDELIIALDFYLRYRPSFPSKGSREIAELSAALNRLGSTLFLAANRSATFRNENGVYMKLMNFRRFDPTFISEGHTGLTRGNKLEEEVWAEFSHAPEKCHAVTEAILKEVESPEVKAGFAVEDYEDIQEAPEGRVLTRVHLVRERNRKLVSIRKARALQKTGKLACEVCGFDYVGTYGERGKGFIECHHTRPVSELAESGLTKIEDLALVCANCHRMIHYGKVWLTIDELKSLYGSRARAATQA